MNVLAPSGPPEPQHEGTIYDPTAPDPEFLFEVVDGIIVRKTVGAAEIRLAHNLYQVLNPVVRDLRFGECYLELGYALTDRGPGRKPDLSVLSFARWPADRPFPPGDFLPAMPELAVEVISPHETITSARRKVREYFRGGVEVVRLVVPSAGEVHVYTSPTAVHILIRDDTLTGDPIIPGFRLPLADLFPPAEPTPETL